MSPRLRTAMLTVCVLSGMLWSADTARAHVILDDPNGGEQLEVDTVFVVRWRIQIAHTLLNWDLWYSTTGMAGPWTSIATNLLPGSGSVGSIHTYNWTIPDDPDPSVWVRVRMDNSGTDYEDVSNASFSIVAACMDGDGDGYGSPGDGSCDNGSEEDCDDGDPDIHPGATEVCDDFADNDCDGHTDGDDSDCGGPTAHQVVQVGFTFEPADITVVPGDYVEWHWSDLSHTLTSGTPCTPDNVFFNEPFDAANPLVTFVVPNDGTTFIPYFCIPHCNRDMTGTITIECPVDVDGDGDVDLDDYGAFEECFAGPDGGLGIDCAPFDLDGSQSIDLTDYAGFQRRYTG